MLPNKKVCILTTVHPALDVRIFHKEAKTLASAGYNVTLIAQHDKEEIVEGIKIIPLPKPKNRLERFLKLDYLLLKKAFEQKADIYHFHDPELVSIGILLKLFRKKVIYDVHEDYEAKMLNKDWIPRFLRKSIAIGFGAFEKLFSKIFDYIIVADNVIYPKFRHFLINKMVIVRNFPPIHNFKQEKNKGKNKTFVCIYAGGLSENRGLFKMVEALKYINSSIELFLLGGFENKEDLNELKGLEEFKRVKYFGQKSWHEVMKFLAVSDAGLNLLQPVPAYLYAGENTIKIFEYMMMGLPVISSDFPNLRKIIEEAKCGICVDPANSKEIAKAIEYLTEHPDEARKMGENGRKAVLEKYNWENESKKLLKVYEELSKK